MPHDHRHSDGDADHETMLAREAAVRRLRSLREELLSERPAESVPLDRIAGRTAAEPVDAPEALPAHDHATMDGYAFAADDDYPLNVVDEVYPEDGPPTVGRGEAVRITTGAPLPESADAVLKQEEATVERGRLRGPATEAGTYIYERGTNVAAGERLVERGERLAPKDALLLGDLGLETVSVVEPLSVGLLATGTEIHEDRTRDLDSPMLAGLVRAWGHEATYEGTVPDQADRVAAHIERLAAAHDVVVTTGGTSVGPKDHVLEALKSLGEVLFHRVRIRPGKPIAVARLADHNAVAIAIPGKPVGAHAIATLVSRPFFTGESGLPVLESTAARGVTVGVEGFEYAVPVTLERGKATPLGHADSPLSVYEDTFDPSVLSSSTRATRADGFVLTATGFEAGEAVSVVPYPVVER